MALPSGSVATDASPIASDPAVRSRAENGLYFSMDAAKEKVPLIGGDGFLAHNSSIYKWIII